MKSGTVIIIAFLVPPALGGLLGLLASPTVALVGLIVGGGISVVLIRRIGTSETRRSPQDTGERKKKNKKEKKNKEKKGGKIIRTIIMVVRVLFILGALGLVWGMLHAFLDMLGG